MGKRNRRRLKRDDSGDESDGSLPDMTPRKQASNTVVSDVELTTQHVVLESIPAANDLPAAPPELNAAIFGLFGQAGFDASGPFQALHAHLAEPRKNVLMATELFERRMGMFPNLPRSQFESRMAEQLVVHDPVTRVPTLGEYQMDKEKDIAFRKLVLDFQWCARNGRLTHKDRTSDMGRHFLNGDGIPPAVRVEYEKKLRGIFVAHYRA